MGYDREMTGIRCDANSIIASGHMMRCLTIAKELVRQGESVTFFLADEESKGLFDACRGGEIEHCDAVVLGTNWRDMEAELPILIKELPNRDITRILVDSYSVTPTYFHKLKEICPVVYIDDLKADIYPVDVLINYSGYYKSLGYEEAYRGVCGHRAEPVKLLLGLKYAPLREQFYRTEDETAHEEAGKTPGSEDMNVLLTSGGADTRGMLLATLLEAEKQGLLDGGITWHVVVGSLVKDDGAITSFAGDHEPVQIHKAVTDMAGLMRKCNIAICAAGTMLTECAAIGLPAIFYQVADNQKYNVEFWSSTGGMIFAGDATEETEKTIENICRKLKDIIHGKDRCAQMKGSLSGLTDGRGAVHIAEEIMYL